MRHSVRALAVQETSERHFNISYPSQPQCGTEKATVQRISGDSAPVCHFRVPEQESFTLRPSHTLNLRAVTDP